MTLKIAIFGAGAVGCVLAAQLARAGHQVSVIARGANLHALRTKGLDYQSPSEAFNVSVAAFETAAEAGQQDVVFVTTKAQALVEIAPLLSPLLHADTPIIFAQNGLPWWYHSQQESVSLLWEHIDLKRVIGCVVHCPCRIEAPGKVLMAAVQGRFIIGEVDGQLSSRLIALQQQCSLNLEFIATDDLRRHIWEKLCINLPGSLLTTLTHSFTADIVATPALRTLMLALYAETQAVAATQGYQLADEGSALLERLALHRHAPSMLQDLLAARSLEIDAQIGAVQRLARAAQLATPHLDLLLPLLEQRNRATAQLNRVPAET